VLPVALLPTAPDIGIPVLVLEVLSPSTAKRDREDKARICLEAGVEEIYLIDRRDRSVERITKAGSEVHRGGKPVASTVVSEVECGPERLFTGI
jgi:hypothetical protein